MLKIENNHYTISGDFVDIMQAQRNKFTLALGLNIKKYTHLIIFSNYSINLAFIVDEKSNFSYNELG
ncbi:hypothetical protein [Chryseobacterium arachidis]|uniref:hypothetical protein n=1 Tax=Chryseobacterium arachidis TaxID=1416778 RepID=UPI0011605EF6|nr:hypothetical protein [Chryseobacterium arachidis]